jgi:Ferritin-like domain
VTEDADMFLKTAVAFEDLAVEAYKGQAPRIASPTILAAAVAIHSVEARHAAWMRYLAGVLPAARAFDDAKPLGQVRRLVASTNFVVARPRKTGRRAPRFTG